MATRRELNAAHNMECFNGHRYGTVDPDISSAKRQRCDLSALVTVDSSATEVAVDQPVTEVPTEDTPVINDNEASSTEDMDLTTSTTTNVPASDDQAMEHPNPSSALSAPTPTNSGTSMTVPLAAIQSALAALFPHAPSPWLESASMLLNRSAPQSTQPLNPPAQYNWPMGIRRSNATGTATSRAVSSATTPPTIQPDQQVDQGTDVEAETQTQTEASDPVTTQAAPDSATEPSNPSAAAPSSTLAVDSQQSSEPSTPSVATASPQAPTVGSSDTDNSPTEPDESLSSTEASILLEVPTSPVKRPCPTTPTSSASLAVLTKSGASSASPSSTQKSPEDSLHDDPLTSRSISMVRLALVEVVGRISGIDRIWKQDQQELRALKETPFQAVSTQLATMGRTIRIETQQQVDTLRAMVQEEKRAHTTQFDSLLVDIKAMVDEDLG